MQDADPGVEVWLPRAICEGDDCLNNRDMTRLHNAIGYGCRGGQWEILVTETVANDVTQDADAWRSASPLADSKHSVLLAAAPHLAELVRAVSRRAEEFTLALRMGKEAN
jgi:hypothetical protein